MRRKTFFVVGLALLALLAFVAAGCGGGSSNTAATTEAVTTEEVTTTEEATTTEETTTAESTTTEEATTTEALDVSGLASADNCRQLAEIGSKLSQAYSGSGTSAQFDDAVAVLNELGDKAPDDIKADFKTMAAFVVKVKDATEGVTPGKTPDPAQLQKLQALQADAAKVTTASQHITAWVAANCHA